MRKPNVRAGSLIGGNTATVHAAVAGITTVAGISNDNLVIPHYGNRSLA